MPAPTIILAVNVNTRQFVTSNGGGSFGRLTRGVFTIRVYLRQISTTLLPGAGDVTAAFDASAYDGIRLGLWQTNPGTEANVLALTDQTAWTYNNDLSNPYFEGTFYTNTTEIETWIAGKACADCFMDLGLVSGSEVTSILELPKCGVANFEILNRIDPGSGNGISVTGATPFVTLPFNMRSATGYYTWAESSPGVLDYTYTAN